MPHSLSNRSPGRVLLHTFLVLCVIVNVSKAQPRFQPEAPPAQPQAQPQGPLAQPEPFDECQVLARIGKQVVLSCELLWLVNLRLEENRHRIPPDQIAEAREHLLRQELNGSLDLKLVYADFRSRAPQADLAQIHKNLSESFEENRLPALMKQLGVKDQAGLSARLRELGGTIEDVRQEYYQSTIARQWARESVKISNEVTHAEMLDYYRENGERYDFPAQAKWEELMVRFSRFDNRDQAWAAIAQMGNAALPIAAGATDASQPAFAEIAKAGSQGFTAKDGGQHDWTTKDALAAETINEALFTLRTGEMSPILKSEQGLHIIRVLERKEAGRKPFSEVQTEIRNRIRGKRFDVAIKAKISELREKTQIWTIYNGTSTAAAYIDSSRLGSLRR